MEIEKKNAMVESYQLIKTLGSGYHAKVKLGYSVETGNYAALKIFKSQHSIAANLKTLKNEIDIMKKLHHANIVNLIDVKESTDYIKKNGQTKKVMAIIMEYINGGELFEYVANTGRFSEEVSRTYFHQMVAGLEYIHGQGFAHRDLKPENLLFDAQFNLRIADFGFSTLLAGKDGSGLLHTILGTESYMAPEIHAKKPYVGTSVDLFAAAIILFIMYAGTPPFNKADSKDPYYRLLCTNKHETFWAAHSKHKPSKDFFSPSFKNLMNSLLAEDPKQRITISELKQNEWFSGPIISSQQLFNEFDQRRKKVDQELEKARLQKAKEKEEQKKRQAQTPMMYTGRNFRSGEQITAEFQGIENKFKLDQKRKLKLFDNKMNKPNNFYTTLDADYLLKVVLNNSRTVEENKSEDKDNENKDQWPYIVQELKDNKYKIVCQAKDAKLASDLEFSIEFYSTQDDMILLDFQKSTGNALHFQNVVKGIKDMIENIQTIKQ